MIGLRFGNTQLTKKPAAPGASTALDLLHEIPEQSGDVLCGRCNYPQPQFAGVPAGPASARIGAVPRDRQRLGRAQPAGGGAVREAWSTSAVESASGAFCQGGRAAVCRPWPIRSAAARRSWHLCHHGSGPGRRQDRDRDRDRDRPDLGLCARRQAFWRAGPAGGGVLLLTRSCRRTSSSASGQLQRGSCRPMPMAAMASFTTRAATQVRSWKPPVGSTPGVRSS
jgi:hypothetical protein